MSRATPATILTALNWRYAVKQFDPTRKIDAAVWADLEKSLALTPSSFGLQPWQFLIVDNPDIRAQLVPHSWHQRQVADASHLVIMAVRTSIDHAYINSYLDDVAATRQTNRDALAGFEKMLTGASSMLTPEWAARQAYIALGQFMLAAAILGRPFAIEGKVIHGDKRGRTIGVPTANVSMADYMRPAYGVYATRTRLPDGRVIDGVANLGVRPMFEIDQPLLEVWLFDFDGDLYGQTIETELVAFLRGEMAFDGLEALKIQIAADASAAREALS